MLILCLRYNATFIKLHGSKTLIIENIFTGRGYIFIRQFQYYNIIFFDTFGVFDEDKHIFRQRYYIASIQEL